MLRPLVYRSLLICGAMDWLSPSLPFIAALQKLTFLRVPAIFFSFLGNEEFFLLLLPFVYWCIDRKTGARLGILLLFSAALNDLLKVAFALPRPYWLDSSLALLTENTFGFPSGHAQNAALLWTFLASRSRNPKLWVPLALLLAVSIAFSRIVLGVHFPADAFGGAFIGFALLGLWLRFGSLLENWFKTRPLGWKIGLAALAALAIYSIYAALAGRWPVEADGSPFAKALGAANSGEAIVSRVGALFGLLVGLSLAQKLDFEAVAPFSQKLARLFIGLIGLAVFYFGLKKIFPDELPFRFGRYALTTFWVSFGAPLVFERLGLAGRSEVEAIARVSGS